MKTFDKKLTDYQIQWGGTLLNLQPVAIDK